MRTKPNVAIIPISANDSASIIWATTIFAGVADGNSGLAKGGAAIASGMAARVATAAMRDSLFGNRAINSSFRGMMCIHLTPR